MKTKREERTGDDVLKILTVRLPVWLHRALKVKTAQEARSLQDVAFDKFSEYVGGKPAGPRQKARG